MNEQHIHVYIYTEDIHVDMFHSELCQWHCKVSYDLFLHFKQ